MNKFIKKIAVVLAMAMVFTAMPMSVFAEEVALPDINGNPVIGEKPTATVNNLGSMIVKAGEYSNVDNIFDKNTTEDMSLSFVVQFLADQDAEDMETSPFADWYGDFVITFDGLENGAISTEGIYLAGHYGSFGWVKVPVEGIITTIENGARYPVMLGVGMGQKYDYICSGVQDFKCAMYIPDNIIEANPDIEVKLELCIVDNNGGSDAATAAIIANENIYTVNEHVYTAEDFVTFVASANGKKYTTLQSAVANANGGTVTLLENIDLPTAVEVTSDVTVDLAGKTITLKEDTVGDGAFHVTGGTLTINDSVGGAVVNGVGNNNYSMALWADGGHIVINAGKYTNVGAGSDDAYDLIYAKNSGTVKIYGGTFEAHTPKWTLNQHDSTNGKITVYGGTFVGVNPAEVYTEPTQPLS
ncbi:MAG: hypothetical protein J6B21_07280, partial [Oscillospiraceae bacterium]|nr:hypothetical protein [Oscillospiraceae bacterium]